MWQGAPLFLASAAFPRLFPRGKLIRANGLDKFPRGKRFTGGQYPDQLPRGKLVPWTVFPAGKRFAHRLVPRGKLIRADIPPDDFPAGSWFRGRSSPREIDSPTDWFPAGKWFSLAFPTTLSMTNPTVPRVRYDAIGQSCHRSLMFAELVVLGLKRAGNDEKRGGVCDM